VKNHLGCLLLFSGVVTFAENNSHFRFPNTSKKLVAARYVFESIPESDMAIQDFFFKVSGEKLLKLTSKERC
jgi:hypothetical protein